MKHLLFRSLSLLLGLQRLNYLFLTYGPLAQGLHLGSVGGLPDS